MTNTAASEPRPPTVAPRWHVEVAIKVGPLAQTQLDHIVNGLLAVSRRDEDHVAPHDRRPAANPHAAGHITADGAEFDVILYASDVHWATERAEMNVRRLFEEVRIDSRVPRLTASATLLEGSVDPREGFRLHVSAAVADLDEPLAKIQHARRELEIALAYADEIGQQRAGLEAAIADIDALHSLTYEASMPLIQRLAELETGTRG